MKTTAVTCPVCRRELQPRHGKFYPPHRVAAYSGARCPLSNLRHIPESLSDNDFVTRAQVVLDMAWQIQDGDPAIVQTWLASLSAEEVRRLMVIALAGLQTGSTVDDTFAWVTELPAALVVAS